MPTELIEVDESEIPDDEPSGHICIYLFGLEIHTDLIFDDTNMEAVKLADAVADFVRMIILKTLENPNADVRPTSVQ